MSRPRSSSRRTDPPDRPLLGALLRLANQVMGQELVRWLAASGHTDIQPAHCAAIQALWTRPEGARLTELAQMARVTKQSMGALVDHLCRVGHAERLEDPDDRRASRVRLTARGRAFTKEIRAFVRGVEADWARRVGARRIRDLQETLAAIVLEPAERS